MSMVCASHVLASCSQIEEMHIGALQPRTQGLDAGSEDQDPGYEVAEIRNAIFFYRLNSKRHIFL
jgi:hypothetical protein